MQASIREMKNRLSEYLKVAQTGRDVVITDRGRPVARLTLVTPSSLSIEAEAVSRINALPWVRRGAGGKPLGSKLPIPSKARQRLLSQLILEDRE
jgi:prevent-host-death family protein